MRFLAGVLAAIVGLVAAPAVHCAAAQREAQDEAALAQRRWQASPHGSMLERLLPPTVERWKLPEPQSEGARLAAAYCVQCHYLPSPAMHDAAKWPPIVERMVWRMEGKGNLGALMHEMMAGIQAPSAREVAVLVAYLQKHAQQAIDPARYPDLSSPTGQIYAIACSQCHVLPDPKRHPAREWPQVVERMARNMAWANRVVGDNTGRTTPELDRREIVRFLQRHAR